MICLGLGKFANVRLPKQKRIMVAKFFLYLYPLAVLLMSCTLITEDFIMSSFLTSANHL